MKSMTGFGSAEYSDEKQSISIEIKTVNNRYRDFSFRLSRKLSSFEELSRRIISARMARGHIELSAKYLRYASAPDSLYYDSGLAKSYFGILLKIIDDCPGVSDKITAGEIAGYPYVVTANEASDDSAELEEIYTGLLNKALDSLEASRTQEGETLLDDFIKRIDGVGDNVDRIRELSDAIPKAYYETLMKNVSDYTGGLISEDRLATEMAVYADRVNITEEIVRLRSHIASFKKMLGLSEPVGRKLDFTLQEINREVNTIASKSNSFEISTIVVDIKAELEKIREQVQNIE